MVIERGDIKRVEYVPLREKMYTHTLLTFPSTMNLIEFKKSIKYHRLYYTFDLLLFV